MLTKRHKIIIASVLAGLLTIGLSYFWFVYEFPEDCFVRELKEWGEREGLTDKLSGGGDKSDNRLSVAKAKTILSEYNTKDISGDTRKIYLRIDTLMEYCEVE